VSILGFDTATADTAVAVLDGTEAMESLEGPSDAGRPAHGRVLLPAIERAVAEVGGWREIELIAVGIGPGSFTGLRIGVSTGRALAQARGLPLAAVASTAALAAGIAELPEAASRSRLALIDARRGEVFAAFDPGTGPRPPLAVAPGELAERLGAGELRGAVAGGDGSIRFRPEIEAAGVEVLPDESPAHRLSARQICLLAAKTPPVEVEQLVPMYLRRPDAERWHERNHHN